MFYPYGYGYYGYGDFLANNLYVLLLIPVMLLSLWAQFQVSGNFRRYNAVNNRRHLTGAQAAEAVLRAHGVYDVPIRPCRGSLTDHYDPRDNTIYLSQDVYDAPTVAAVGVACHEAGHAVQYAVGYGPVRLRTAIIPVTQFGSQFAFIALILGLVLYVQPLFAIGIVLFGLTTVFQLVTLPVEFDASARAIGTIEGTTNVYPKNLEETLYLFGETGTVKIGGTSTNNIDVWEFADEQEADKANQNLQEATSNVYGNGHTSLYADMIDAIEHDRKPYVDAVAGRNALEMVLAIYKSQKEGVPVKLPLKGFKSTDMAGEFDV